MWLWRLWAAIDPFCTYDSCLFFLYTTNFLGFIIQNLILLHLQVYACEDSNKHSGAFVFLTAQFLASIPFLFLISISSSLVFYFLVGLRNEFSYMMYFVVNFFICLLVNEGLVLVIVTILQDVFWSIVILVFMQVSFLLCCLQS